MPAALATSHRSGAVLLMLPLTAAIAGVVASGSGAAFRVEEVLPALAAGMPSMLLLAVLAAAQGWPRRRKPQGEPATRVDVDGDWDTTIALMQARCVLRQSEPEPFDYPLPGFDDARLAWGG